MKKNKGFTLVELLAVIAILAILVIMALPAVLRMYRQSRINNFQNEVRGVYKSAQQQFVSDSINLESGNKILYTNATSCEPEGVDVVKQLDMTGNVNLKYYVLMNVDGKVLNVRATNGTYSYSLKTASAKNDLKIENIDVESNNDSTLDSNIESTLCLSEEDTYIHIATVVDPDNCDKTTPTCELTIAGENFYVVSNNLDETILLSKKAINSTSNEQIKNIASYTTVSFADVGYWDGQQCTYSDDWSCVGTPSGLLAPYNNGATYCTSSNSTNCTFVYDNHSNLSDAVNAYARKISTLTGITIEGRVLTLEEAYNLDNSIRNISITYWIGSAYGGNLIWSVSGNGGINASSFYDTRSIRPVIIVPTSAL